MTRDHLYLLAAQRALRLTIFYLVNQRVSLVDINARVGICQRFFHNDNRFPLVLSARIRVFVYLKNCLVPASVVPGPLCGKGPFHGRLICHFMYGDKVEI